MFEKLCKTAALFTGEILGVVVVPLALIFTPKDAEHLPKWAYPWCNEWDGTNGRANNNHWQKRWGAEGVKKYWPRFLWLAVRNRASNLSQMLGKKDPKPEETFRAKINIPFTGKMFKVTWGYTSYLPGDGDASLEVMPKHNFTTSISLRDRD